MRKRVLVLSLLMFLSGGAAFGLNNEASSTKILSQKCIINENGEKVCFADELMKEMIKQTIYTVGTKALNKYMNGTTPIVVPQTYTTPVTTTVPQTTTTTTTQTPTQTTTEEQMIIVQ